MQLIFLVLVLIFVGLTEVPITYDTKSYSRIGIYAALIFWVWFGMKFTPDGPFLQPHPLIWRFTFVISIVYELFLIYLLFQVRGH